MANNTQLVNLVKLARQQAPKRNFDQSVEMTIVLKDIDIKKGFTLNEVVSLANKPERLSKICVIASGDMGTRARKAQVDKVIEPEELARLGSNKREARKLVRAFDFFLADTSLMSSVGRSLGQFLGPKGKMPTPFSYGAPIETIAERFRGSIRIRAKNQLNLSTRIGDENMQDEDLAANAGTVISVIEKKLPQGEKNIDNAMIKFTMGKPSKLSTVSDEKQKGVK
jgi:large subunit ribosomal protein L1